MLNESAVQKIVNQLSKQVVQVCQVWLRRLYHTLQKDNPVFRVDRHHHHHDMKQILYLLQ